MSSFVPKVGDCGVDTDIVCLFSVGVLLSSTAQLGHNTDGRERRKGALALECFSFRFCRFRIRACRA